MGQTADEITGGDRSNYYGAGANNPAQDVPRDTSAGDSQDPEEIRQDIEQTRAQMSKTIDAIQERLDPDNLKEQAKEVVRDATVGRAEEVVSNVSASAKGFGNTMLETIKQNPIPAALVGIGLGWLWMRSQDEPHRQSQNLNNYVGGSGQYGGRYASSRYLGYEPSSGRSYRQYDTSSSGGGPAQAVADAAGNAADKVGQVVGDTGEKIGDVAGTATDRMGQVAGSAGDAVGQLGDQAQYRAEQATDFFQRSMRENPLAMGAVAVAVGAAIGLLVPETEQEHQLMGQARDNLVDKAQGAVQQTMDKVQQVAQEATDTAKQAARDEGLTS